jgi:Ricin-type beta-trefoil lectin domain
VNQHPTDPTRQTTIVAREADSGRPRPRRPGGHNRAFGGRSRRLAALAVLLAAAVGVVMSTAQPASAAILPGYHQIQDKSWHLCLDVTGAATYEDAPVGAWWCVNAANQRWARTAASGPTQLRVEHSQMCLGVQWVGNGYGSQVVQRDCRYAPLWTIVDQSDGWSEIRTVPPAAPGRPAVMCLDKTGWNTVMWDCHQPPWQLWQSLG